MMTEISAGDQNVNRRVSASRPRRVAFYGGSFDPVHRGHTEIARTLIEQFELDDFIFIPAFHAPHKVRLMPTSAYDRYAMLCLATQKESKMAVSRMEIETPDRPFTVETLTKLNLERPDDEKFFVMGVDSWMDITTWREWEKVLSIANHIVVTRPGLEPGVSHVTDDIRRRIADLRGSFNAKTQRCKDAKEIKDQESKIKGQSSKIKGQIFITDKVNLDISATEVRRQIREDDSAWREDVPPEVANYIEKYQIYK